MNSVNQTVSVEKLERTMDKVIDDLASQQKSISPLEAEHLKKGLREGVADYLQNIPGAASADKNTHVVAIDAVAHSVNYLESLEHEFGEAFDGATKGTSFDGQQEAAQLRDFDFKGKVIDELQDSLKPKAAATPGGPAPAPSF